MRASGFKCADCEKSHIGWVALRRAKRHGRVKNHRATHRGASSDRGRRSVVRLLGEDDT